MKRAANLLLSILLTAPAFAATEEGVTFFNREVLPILEAKCYECHGGGDKLRGGLRLTSREGLLHGGDLGPAFDQANPGESLLLEMISYKDDEHQMPPKAKLSGAEMISLRKWVEMGAPYDPAKEIRGALAASTQHVTEKDFEYWAYRPVERPPVPAAETVRHPIDAFLAARLGKEGLSPNSRASRSTLVRRAFYDLTGLPPAPEEVDRFVNDPRPEDKAWEALIDDLLSRPQYGEKWARHWLDLVRYAETNGFERDNPKPEIWRYRDYVIQAFNQDKPYNQFIIEQLAGDEIDRPTMESLAATGFHRLMQWDDEPADRLQHTYDVLADNIAITTEAFLGTTIGCARCHDHKADPFTQKDYYSLMAFFHGVTPYATPGTIVNWSSPAEAAAFEKEREARLEKLATELATLENDLTAYLREKNRLGGESAPAVTFVDDARGKPAIWAYTEKEPGAGWQDVGTRVRDWILAHGGFGTRGTPGAIVGTEWRSANIWMRTEFGLTSLPSSLALEIHHDEDVEVYLNGVEIYRARGFLVNYQPILLDGKALDALQTGKNVLAVHCRQSGGGQYIDVSLRTAPRQAGDLADALRNGGGGLGTELRQHFGRDVAKEWNDLKKRITEVKGEKPGIPINAVVEAGANPRPLQVHIRGSAHAPGDPVEPAFPAVLHQRFEPQPAVIPASYAKNGSSGRRRVLAEWLASAENPLTTRVIVNRLWQHHFGKGIVPSTSDFGKLGEAPDHPELLDWLAAELVNLDWSLKKMHRLIMLSDAYQRSSTPAEAALAKDPTNRFFWRQDMRRLTAEEIRDSILAVSGNLNLKMAGPPIFPPLPPEVLATASRPDKAWQNSNEEESNRRSIYVHVKRSLRMPILVEYDQADTDSHCAVRFATTVPTQALGMLNSRFVNDQAAVFAERVRKTGGDLESQVRHGLRLALQREPSSEQISESVSLIQALQKEAGLSPEAALDRFALMALNLNEFIYLD